MAKAQFAERNYSLEEIIKRNINGGYKTVDGYLSLRRRTLLRELTKLPEDHEERHQITRLIAAFTLSRELLAKVVKLPAKTE